jgi:hypothetical protein
MGTAFTTAPLQKARTALQTTRVKASSNAHALAIKTGITPFRIQGPFN